MADTRQETQEQERVISPEALDAYVRVTKPGISLMTAALFVFVAALFLWGFTGTLPQTLTVNGTPGESGGVLCYIEAAKLDRDITGCPAKIRAPGGETVDATVTRVSDYPLSGAEIAAAQPNDWLADMLAVDGYAYEVTLTADKPGYEAAGIVSATLITAETTPISLLFN
jgi:hypothetical protein